LLISSINSSFVSKTKTMTNGRYRMVKERPISENCVYTSRCHYWSRNRQHRKRSDPVLHYRTRGGFVAPSNGHSRVKLGGSPKWSSYNSGKTS
jgi:hypothetical protein